MKNNQMETLIVALKRLAIERQRPFWKSVALDLEAPTRRRRIVNLWKLEQHAKEGEVLLVPGKVLGDGLLTKKVTIAAASCSAEAKRKVASAGGRILSIEELMHAQPDGKNIRIIG
jgi:large subunit ribosomal protein L18e